MPTLPDYIEKAGNVTLAMDNMTVTPSCLKLSAKLIPVLRAIFVKEINEINQRAIKRHMQEDELARTFVDTFGGTLQKRKAQDDILLKGPISSTSL